MSGNTPKNGENTRKEKTMRDGILTEDMKVFELTEAAVAGCHTLDDLKLYFRKHHDGRMINWVAKHPLTALEKMTEVVCG